MKNLVFVFLCLFVSCTTTPTSTVGLLEGSFKGSADFTSAIYNGYSFGCRVTDSLDLVNWVKDKNNLPERTYALGQRRAGKVIFADKAGVIRAETVEESSRWLINQGKISFIVVKDSTVIADFCMGKDPAPNFPR